MKIKRSPVVPKRKVHSRSTCRRFWLVSVLRASAGGDRAAPVCPSQSCPTVASTSTSCRCLQSPTFIYTSLFLAQKKKKECRPLFYILSSFWRSSEGLREGTGGCQSCSSPPPRRKSPAVAPLRASRRGQSCARYYGIFYFVFVLADWVPLSTS